MNHDHNGRACATCCAQDAAATLDLARKRADRVLEWLFLAGLSALVWLFGGFGW